MHASNIFVCFIVKAVMTQCYGKLQYDRSKQLLVSRLAILWISRTDSACTTSSVTAVRQYYNHKKSTGYNSKQKL